MSISRMMAGVGAFRAWDVSTANYVRSFSVSSQDTIPSGVFFKPDGTAMFVAGRTSDNVLKYILSRAWDVSSASYDSALLIPSPIILEDVSFKPDGTKMYILDNDGNEVSEYNLPTPWSFASASLVVTEDITGSSNILDPRGLFFKPDGTKAYVAGRRVTGLSSVVRYLNEYSLSSAWDLSSISYTSNLDVTSQVSDPEGVFFKPDGKRLYLITGVDIKEYTLSTPWDISTATSTRSFVYPVGGREGRGAFFRQDGKRLYVVSGEAIGIDEYGLGNAARSQTFITAGTYTFTVPSGITSVNLRLVGGSGGGASGGTTVIGDKNPVTTDYFGGDGGSGALATKALSVTPGQSLTVVVGAGGAGGAAPGVVNVAVNPGSNGADSTVTQSASVVARADAGFGAPSTSDGAGGLASASIGDTAADGVTGAGGAGGFGASQSGTAGVSGTVTITW